VTTVASDIETDRASGFADDFQFIWRNDRRSSSSSSNQGIDLGNSLGGNASAEDQQIRVSGADH